ncbi:hypothetical protein ACOSZF_22325 [Cytobacillus firmus]|uniref:hypothetical protein n=1 Tax=Cytobacillus firmus TaxID=1399 RepID=UPI0018CF1410|nr:hypothetical protein [Cytobacillus firmus]MBG9547315.1 hypothetical protein [Cytobacillus firmus]MBG9602140.1 hypothetical protein [Cytobacillus firmus]MBG9656240.1 hypothetical protein [Cytobacillus firmus]MED1906806.1 hypothetical protein [Cytobacillus firmus]MED1943040.1 hypothetical protein [Cytobacillus firmus]
MPCTFTATTPVEYVPYDFECYIDSFKNYFGQYTFFDEWKQFWLEIFHKEDEKVKSYVKASPNSNPIMQSTEEDYEMFHIEHETDYGTFTFHFNVEAMHTIKETMQVPVGVINRVHIYIDPDTPYIEEKLKDQRLPYFVRMAGIEKSFICADGNKRVKARIEKGETDLKGYIFWPQHVQRIFFIPLELCFYMFLQELNHMRTNQIENPSEANVLRTTQMHLLANARR